MSRIDSEETNTLDLKGLTHNFLVLGSKTWGYIHPTTLDILEIKLKQMGLLDFARVPDDGLTTAFVGVPLIKSDWVPIGYVNLTNGHDVRQIKI